MKASIVTPSYNCLELLKITIHSLEQQDIHLSEFELIVIDDGSTDGTADYLKHYSGPLNLKPVINSKNLGRAKSRNLGLQAARNEIIIFLDSDIEVRNDFVSVHLTSHKNGSRVSVGKVTYPPDLKTNHLMRYLLQKGHSNLKTGVRLQGKYFITTNSSVPRKELLEIGGFDENFVYYGGEDTEIGIRLAQKLPIYTLPEALGYNRHLRQLDEWLEVIKVYGEYSLPYLFQKHPEYLKEFRLKHTTDGLMINLIMSLFCSSAIYSSLKFLSEHELAPRFVYGYLLYRTYREGYLVYKHHTKTNIN